MIRNGGKVLITFFLVFFLIPVSGSTDLSSETLDIGLWDIVDCKKTSDAAGFFLYMSGVLLETADKQQKSGNEKKSEKSYEGALFFSQLSANAARNFDVFCKK